VLTLSKVKPIDIVSIPIANENIHNLLESQWLLTNNRGGYCSSSIAGCNTHRYHGLLVGALTPPTNRILALAQCMEMIICSDNAYNLSTFEFNDRFTPEGYRYLRSFHQDTGVHFHYEVDGNQIIKSVYLDRNSDTVAIEYYFQKVAKSFDFTVRPFAALRDFHSLQKSYSHIICRENEDGLLIKHNIPDSCELGIVCNNSQYIKDTQWWFNFAYRTDKQRGQEYNEDLWSPGFFRTSVKKPARIVLWATLGKSKTISLGTLSKHELKDIQKDLRDHQHWIINTAKAKDPTFQKLCLAADAFITQVSNRKQQNCDTAARSTILAGYPWFADWGRDAFISLPGLLLRTNRLEDAKSVLTTFARASEDGMIPNRFDDYEDTPSFNSIDSSLWFINAAFEYYKVANDTETFQQELLPVIKAIIDSYIKGTRFGIHSDTDGLITGGDKNTQLTWMDTKVNGVAFTPRHGKAVEVNALWYNSLCLLAQYFTDINAELAKDYHNLADKVEINFRRKFWNADKNCLYDCIGPDGTIDSSIRPNQIFAVSLGFSPLTNHHQKLVVDCVRKHLVTNYGLRSLSPEDRNYHGRFEGPPHERDQAYHQGTVWPYLIGPFVESFLKVNNYSFTSKNTANQMLSGLINHLTETGCLGNISEIFDGDEPHKPRGCIAQAWSVAEVLRIYHLINR